MRPWLEHDAVLEARRRLAHPSRPETRRQGKDRRQAQEARVQTPHNLGRPDRLGLGAPERGGRRHRRRSSGAAPPGQAAHRPARSAGRCRRPGRDPGAGPPSLPGPDLHLYQVLTSMPGIGVPAAAVFLAETLGKTSRHRRPAGLLRRPDPGHTPLRLIDPRRARLPHRQQETRTRHVPVRLRLPDRSRLPRLLPAQTGPGQAPWARPCSPWPTAASSPCTP